MSVFYWKTPLAKTEISEKRGKMRPITELTCCASHVSRAVNLHGKGKILRARVKNTECYCALLYVNFFLRFNAHRKHSRTPHNLAAAGEGACRSLSLSAGGGSGLCFVSALPLL